jgi:hypothetical protein
MSLDVVLQFTVSHVDKKCRKFIKFAGELANGLITYSVLAVNQRHTIAGINSSCPDIQFVETKCDQNTSR